MIEDCFTK